MKKIVSAILTVLIVISTFLTVPVFAREDVELKLTDATVYAGDEFEVKLFISDNSQLSGAVIDLAYDGAMLEFISAEKGAILDKNAMTSIKEFSKKSIYKYVRFTYMAPSSSITSEGILFSVKFKALETVEGQTTVKISIPNAGDFVNSDLDKLSYTVDDSTIKIINTTYENAETPVENSSTENDTSITETNISTTESTTESNQDANENKDNDNLKLVIGLFTAGGVIIIGVIVYLIVSKKKKG